MNGDAYIDEYDLFVAQFDGDRDGAVEHLTQKRGEGCGVVQKLGRELDGGRLRSRLGDADQHALFLRGATGDFPDERVFVRRIAGVEYDNVLWVREGAHLDRRGVDVHAAPGEIDLVDALLQRDQPLFLDERGGRIAERDDHTGSELMGNKVRKLEYLLADAQAQHATHVITCGGEQSNHARATAMAARLQRAGRLLEGLEATAEHGWLVIWSGHVALFDHNDGRGLQLYPDVDDILVSTKKVTNRGDAIKAVQLGPIVEHLSL